MLGLRSCSGTLNTCAVIEFVSDRLLFERILDLAPPGLSPIAAGPLGNLPLLKANDRVIGSARVVDPRTGRDFGASASVVISGRRGMSTIFSVAAFDELGLNLGSRDLEITPSTDIDGATISFPLDITSIVRSHVRDSSWFTACRSCWCGGWSWPMSKGVC